MRNPLAVSRMTLSSTSGILSDILQHKKEEVAELHQHAAALEQKAYDHAAHTRPFADALKADGPSIIAEIKKASPSRGLLQADFHPARIARMYETGGAACLSVLTDRQYFQGSLHDLEAARAAVNLPVLRKDFTVDRLQIFEAAAHGADAILLIAAALDTQHLTHFREIAESLNMAALVEVHEAEELRKAVDSGANIIGVNNRDLQTFEVSLDTSIRLALQMPSGVTRVSESGIFTRGDVAMLRDAGYDAFLVGESLMKSSDPAAALRELVRDGRHAGH